MGTRSPKRGLRCIAVLAVVTLIAAVAILEPPTAQAQALEDVAGTVVAGGEPLPGVAVFTIATDELGVQTGPGGDVIVPTVPVVDDDWTVAALQSASTPRFIAPFTVDSTTPPVELSLPAIELAEVTLVDGPYGECANGSLDPRCVVYEQCILNNADASLCDESDITFLSPPGSPSPPDALEWSWTGTTVDNRVTVPVFAGTPASISVTSPGAPTQLVIWDGSLTVEIELEPAWFRDGDGDGFGNRLEAGVIQADPPGADYVANRGDCDDFDPAVSPAATEIPGNDVDEDCDGQAAPAVAVDVSVQVFPVAGLEDACVDPFNDFTAGQPIDDAPFVVGELGLVSYCIVVTNNDTEATIEFAATTEPELEVVGLTFDPQQVPPGESFLVAAPTSVELDEAPLTVTVTSSDPTQQFTATDTASVDVRRVPVTIGDYVIGQVGDVFDVVLEIDATVPVGALTIDLSYDPAIIQPASDSGGSVCSSVAADESFCNRVAENRLALGGATLDATGWTGPTQVLSIPFVAVAPGSTSLDLVGIDGFGDMYAAVQVPGFVFNERFGGLTADGSAVVQQPTAWFPDLDGDSFGDSAAAAVTAPEPPDENYVENNDDCNDLDAAISPAAIELLGNDVDENCDGSLGGLGVLLGDVSCDGRLGIADAVLIAQYTVSIRTDSGMCPADPASELFLPAADMNGDGVASIADAVIVAQCIVGVDNGFCPSI